MSVDYNTLPLPIYIDLSQFERERYDYKWFNGIICKIVMPGEDFKDNGFPSFFESL